MKFGTYKVNQLREFLINKKIYGYFHASIDIGITIFETEIAYYEKVLHHHLYNIHLLDCQFTGIFH